MKKYLVVVCSIILIVATSVNAFASFTTFVDWQIVDTVLNAEINSQNCGVVFRNTSTPTPAMCDSLGNLKTQKTTYDVMLSMYETLSVYGVSLSANKIQPSVVEWYEYGGYCWIRIIVDAHTIVGANKAFWVGSFAGKILYCDAPDDGDKYSVSGIAGVENYYLTNRPAGTTGNGYLGDIGITYDNWMNIKNLLDSLSGKRFYYAFSHSINGELRYYLTESGHSETYYVCNRDGQLFYYVKDEVKDPSGNTGGAFDATEVVTALNSIYNKLDDGFYVLVKAVNNVGKKVTSLSNDFVLHMNNTVNGFNSVNNHLGTLVDYLSGLMNKQIIERTITYSGTDVFIDWDSSREVVGVDVNVGTNSIYVKELYGSPVDGGRYKYHLQSQYTDSYSIVDDENGNPMIVFTEEYPADYEPIKIGTEPPENAVLYYPFDDDTLNPVVGESTVTVTGTEQYSAGVYGQAYVFSENTSALNGVYSNSSNLFNAENGAYTISTWLYPTGSPTTGYFQFRIGGSRYITLRMTTAGQVEVVYYTTTTTTVTITTGRSLITNDWNHLAVCYDGTTLYVFVNGELCHMSVPTIIRPTGDDFRINSSSIGKVPIGTMVDEFVIVDGAALWTSSFDPYNEAVFSGVEYDYYYLSCSFPKFYSRTVLTAEEREVLLQEWIAANPDEYASGQFPVFADPMHFWQDACGALAGAGNTAPAPTTMGRIGDDVSYIYYDVTLLKWQLYDCVSKEFFDVVDFPIDLNNLFDRKMYESFLPSQFTVSVFRDYVVGKPVWLDIPNDGTITVTYIEYVNWFDSIYSLIDMQIDQLTAISQKVGNSVGDTIINIENTVVEIAPDNDAFNIFYIEKTDGTTESVGETATDAAVFVGDILSMFYRLVFDDALDNAGVIEDFEDVLTTTNTGVNVW